jgi:hypothetical protein
MPSSTYLLPRAGDPDDTRLPRVSTWNYHNDHLTVAAGGGSGEAEVGAVVLVIGEPWGPGGSKAPALRSPVVDTAPLIASVPQAGDRKDWSK